MIPPLAGGGNHISAARLAKRSHAGDDIFVRHDRRVALRQQVRL
jgi:hypothetical protein